MEDFLQKVLFNNTIQDYLEVFITVLVAFIVKRFISRYLAGLLYKLFTRAGKTFHKEYFLSLIIGPLEIFLFLFIIIFAFDKLTLPNFLHFNVFRDIDFKTLLQAVTDGTLIVVFIRLCIRFIKFVALILEEKASHNDNDNTNQLIVFFKDFFNVFLILIGVLLVLHFSFHYRVTNFLTGLSIVGAAIALATKESLENLIASFIIFFDKPFSTGDTVKVQGFNGVVEKIGLRSTRIRTDSKTYITVPNKQMVDTILDNVTLRTQRRVDISLEIDLLTTAAELKTVSTGVKEILQQDVIESSMVYLSNTGKNAHVITIIYFASMSQTFAEFLELQQTVNLQIIELLEKNGVSLAEAITDVMVSQKQP
ncbi:MAG TPA: mechanosensitive ion channel domain-containing protein [Chitinophagaceae bacterium]|nr:mechanosensitive ion channel domain-containing protein [Chitinophagaceae bacterium]